MNFRTFITSALVLLLIAACIAGGGYLAITNLS